MSELALYRVELDGEVFHLVAHADDDGDDMTTQLLRVLNQQFHDPLPPQLRIQRLDGRVVGRVTP